MKQVEWKLEDFYGRYHRQRIRNRDPIPGTAIRIEGERQDARRARTAQMEARIHEIRKEHEKIAVARGRSAAIQGTLQVENILEGVARRVDTAIQQREDTIEALVKHNTQGNEAKTRRSRKFLNLVHKNMFEHVKHMVDKGFKDLDATEPGYQDTALMMACRRGHVEMVAVLLHLGATPNLVNKFGESATNLCYRHWPTHGKPGPTPAEVEATEPGVIRENQEISFKMLKHLLQYGANANHAESNGFTALHEAARNGPVEAIKILLKHKADIKVRDFKGRTPYDYAKEANQTDACSLLERWEKIAPELQPNEFRRKWNAFMKDPDARMTETTSVQEVLVDHKLKENQVRELRGKRGGKFGVVDRPTTSALVKNDLDWRARTGQMLLKKQTSSMSDLDFENDEDSMTSFGPNSFMSLPTRTGTAKSWREKGQSPFSSQPALMSEKPTSEISNSSKRLTFAPPPSQDCARTENGSRPSLAASSITDGFLESDSGIPINSMFPVEEEGRQLDVSENDDLGLDYYKQPKSCPMRLASQWRPLQVPLDDYLQGVAPPQFLERSRFKQKQETAPRADLTYLRKDASKHAFMKKSEDLSQFHTATAKRRHRSAMAVVKDGNAGKNLIRPSTCSALFRGRETTNVHRPHAVQNLQIGTYPDNLYGKRLVKTQINEEGTVVSLEEFPFFAEEEKSKAATVAESHTGPEQPPPLLYNAADTLPLRNQNGGRPFTIAGNRSRRIELHPDDPELKKVYNPRPKTRQALEDPWKATDGLRVVKNV